MTGWNECRKYQEERNESDARWEPRKEKRTDTKTTRTTHLFCLLDACFVLLGFFVLSYFDWLILCSKRKRQIPSSPGENHTRTEETRHADTMLSIKPY